MSTAYKRAEQQLSALEKEVSHIAAREVGGGASGALRWKSDVDRVSIEIGELTTSMEKMIGKAKETDPDKQVYGKTMVTKILDLGGRVSALQAKAEALHDKVAPLAAAEAARLQAEEEEAQMQAQAEAEARAKDEALAKAEAEASAKAKADAEAKARAEAEAAAKAKAEAEAKAKAQAEVEARMRTEAEAKAKAEAEAEARMRAEADAAGTAKAEEAAAAEEKAKLQVEAETAAKALAAAVQGASATPGQAAATSSSSGPPGVIKVSGGRQELDTILAAAGTEKLVVVDFSAAWCGPCRAIAPFLEQLAVEHADTCKFVAVDCEASPSNKALAAESGIRAFPTFHFYRNRARVSEMTGANREGIRAKIRTFSTPTAGQGAANVTQNLVAALNVLKQNCSFEGFCTGARTLLTFVSNVLAHPNDPKYKRVRMGNVRFHNALGQHTGGVECMLACGFRKILEGTEGILVMDNIPQDLPEAKRLLEEAMRSVGAGTAAAAARPAVPQPALAGGIPTAAGVAPGLGGIPGLDGMLQQMMSNPQMMDTAMGMMQGSGGAFGGAAPPPALLQQMMSNPQAMSAAMQLLQNPQMAELAQQMRTGGGNLTPETLNQLNQQMMRDPAMLQASSQLLGSLLGGAGSQTGTGGGGLFPAPGAPAPPAPGAQAAPAASQAAPPSGQAQPPAAGLAAGTGQQQAQGGTENMTEEEMLQLALRRSMEDDPGQNS